MSMSGCIYVRSIKINGKIRITGNLNKMNENTSSSVTIIEKKKEDIFLV